ncbi:hypothetical protein NMY22_g9154 [Coprinellus aureogranulatus]|nr:hypothetical protein NMY22_g9154 [Coprinellus aureogranulatus]
MAETTTDKRAPTTAATISPDDSEVPENASESPSIQLLLSLLPPGSQRPTSCAAHGLNARVSASLLTNRDNTSEGQKTEYPCTQKLDPDPHRSVPTAHPEPRIAIPTSVLTDQPASTHGWVGLVFILIPIWTFSWHLISHHSA